MERNPTTIAARIAVVLLTAGLVHSSGCILVPAFYRGRIAPPACDKLEGQRVAVVCTSNSSDFGPNPNTDLIARRVGSLLDENVKRIDVVSHQKVAAWLDEHDVDFIDYSEIGRGLEADLVVAIEIESIKLQDNPTMYKGRADYALEVIDIQEGGRAIYTPYAPPVIWPRIAGMSTTSVAKEQFRQKFVDVVSGDIARNFYAHDLNQQIAVDTPDLGP